MPSTQLTYSLSTTPGPLTAGLADAIITFTAKNNTGSDVSLQGITIGLPIGTGATNLTNTPGQISVMVAAGLQQTKTNQTSGTYTFVFDPATAPLIVNPGTSLVFTFNNIALNNAAGASNIIITEGTPGSPTQPLLVSVFPGGWGSISYSASPTNLSEPGPIALNWSGPSGATYQIQYIDSTTNEIVTIPAANGTPLNNYGTYPGDKEPPLTISETTLFTLIVTAMVDGTSLTATPQLTIMVAEPAPLITSFTGQVANTNPSQLSLNWTTENASSVTGSWTNNILVANPESPSILTSPYNPSYCISATSGNGNNSNQAFLVLPWEQNTICDTFIYSGSIAVTSNLNTAFILSGNTTNPYVAIISLQNPTSPPITTGAGASGYKQDCLCITPDNRYVFVAGYENFCLSVIDVNNPTVPPAGSIGLHGRPYLLAITANSKYVFVVDDTNTVTAIEVNNPHNPSKPPPKMQVGNGPVAVATTTDNHYLFVLNKTDGTVSVIDITNLTASPKTIPVGKNPIAIGVTIDNNYLFVLNQSEFTVSVIDVNNLVTPPKTIALSGTPVAMAIAPDNSYAVVLCTGGNICLISISEMEVTQIISNVDLGPESNAIAITPDGRCAIITDPVNGVVTVFNLTQLNSIGQTFPVANNGGSILVLNNHQALITNLSLNFNINGQLIMLKETWPQ
ncbi:MAG: hypothetical protein KBB37_00415 [Bacteroidia bacterium]|nr:hypothetical protein [Bacteroidia bacterium]MBP7259720.1 hypothetical protein [Bacteroidia bacterium]MBP9180106.1 hypothetical protein [Bacteroidia bacterium]MBP9723329.1 hypothetical protein [Bacteroidia bacterium]